MGSETEQASNRPEHIVVSKSGGIKIIWGDGHRSEYGLQYLRDHCPCASCSTTHAAGNGAPGSASPFALYKPKLKIEDVRRVGHYAIQIVWNDGHDTGIYTFDYLRRICPCMDCSARPE